MEEEKKSSRHELKQEINIKARRELNI